MIVIKILLLLFISSLSTLAYEVSIEGEGSLKNCSASPDENFIYCKNNKGEDFLLKGDGWEYSAFKRDTSGGYHKVDVYSIYKDSQILFTARLDMDSFLEERERPKYLGPLHQYINNDRYIYSDFLKGDLKILDSFDNEELKKFYQDSKAEIEARRDALENSFTANQFKASMSDGKELNCKRDNNQCPLLQCGEDAQGNQRVIFKNNSATFIYLESFSFKNGQFSVPNEEVISLSDIDGRELIKFNEAEDKVFSDQMTVPSSFRHNPRLFNAFKAPGQASFISSQISMCSDELKNSIQNLIEKVQEDLNNEVMLQYIALSKGILESNFVNKDSIAGITCHHQGAFYTPEAYQRAQELQAIDGDIITPEQAMDLFKRARAREDIAWNYTFDGCYARAHLMAKMFEDEGVRVDKAWLRGSLQIPGEAKGMTWGYHVAPMVYVRGANGEVKKMIIDPSVSSAPISPSEWAETMGVEFEQTEKVSYPTPSNTSFYNKTSFSITNTTPYWPEYNERLSEEEKMDMAKSRMIEFGAAPSQSEEWESWQE